jgi:hypothetical protein
MTFLVINHHGPQAEIIICHKRDEKNMSKKENKQFVFHNPDQDRSWLTTAI